MWDTTGKFIEIIRTLFPSYLGESVSNVQWFNEGASDDTK